MITSQQLHGNWREIRGGIKQRWGELTDDELDQAEGSAEQLIGLIQRKSDETRQEIEEYLEHLIEGSGEACETTADAAREYAEQARQRLQEKSQQVAQQVQAGYVEAEEMMRRRPVESVAIAFGVGLISGLVVGLTIRPR